MQQQEVGIGGDLAAGEVFRLRQSIEEFNMQASAQTQQMLRMTQRMFYLNWTIAGLTIIMTVLVGVQVYLAIIH